MKISNYFKEGYLIINPNYYTNEYYDQSLFIQEYNTLQPDRFLERIGQKINENWNFRKRKIGKFNYNNIQKEITFLNDGNFQQKRTYNNIAHESRRFFEKFSPQLLKDPFFNHILQKDIEIVCEIDNKKKREFNIIVHFIRTTCSHEEIGHPSPEGIHQDDHDLIFIHHISSFDIIEGGTVVYNDAKGSLELLEFKQSTFFETLLINDRRLFHDSLPIKSTGKSGNRDMLLIDIDFI